MPAAVVRTLFVLPASAFVTSVEIKIGMRIPYGR